MNSEWTGGIILSTLEKMSTPHSLLRIPAPLLYLAPLHPRVKPLFLIMAWLPRVRSSLPYSSECERSGAGIVFLLCISFPVSRSAQDFTGIPQIKGKQDQCSSAGG